LKRVDRIRQRAATLRSAEVGDVPQASRPEVLVRPDLRLDDATTEGAPLCEVVGDRRGDLPEVARSGRFLAHLVLDVESALVDDALHLALRLRTCLLEAVRELADLRRVELDRSHIDHLTSRRSGLAGGPRTAGAEPLPAT